MSRARLVLTLIIALFSLALGFAAASTNKQVKPFIPGSLNAIPTFVSTRQDQQVSNPKLEGCVTCHGQIEPMHKYGTTETLDNLKDGKDAVGLTCTGCHGGNPVPRKTGDDPKSIQQIKDEAHVRAKFPAEWQRDGKYTGANPERTNTLLARESWEFVRFINPGRSARRGEDLRRRRLPRSRIEERRPQHDDARRDAVGRGALQQRRLPAEGCAFWRELQRKRRATKSDPDSRNPRSKIGAPKVCSNFSIPSRVGRFRNRAMCCAFSSGEGSGVWKLAYPIRKKIRANRTRD